VLLLKIVKLVYFTRQFILQGKIPVLQGNLQGKNLKISILSTKKLQEKNLFT